MVKHHVLRLFKPELHRSIIFRGYSGIFQFPEGGHHVSVACQSGLCNEIGWTSAMLFSSNHAGHLENQNTSQAR